MFAILSPVLTIPIIMTLTTIKKRSKPPLSTLVRGKEAFWQLDPIGLVLLVAGAGLVLTPVTLGSIEGAWTTQYIVMVVFGAVSSIAFVIFEIYFAKHPLLPFQLLKNRSIIAGFVIAIAHPMAGGAALDYFYTFLVSLFYINSEIRSDSARR